MIHIVAMQYTKSFKLHRGGKAANPQELTLVSDWGNKSVRNRFERCLQRPCRGGPVMGRLTAAANKEAA